MTSRKFNSVFPWVSWGHEAVIVFFVMSGFVIAYVVADRERSVPKYAAARLGRLYSVVIPALVITAVLDAFGRSLEPEVYSSVPNDYAVLRLGANLFFVQQNWNFTIRPLSNGPFWSLGFEFWYYCIFGSWVLFCGRLRIALTVLFSLCAGPRIIAFLPIWLLGVLAYKINCTWKPSPVFLRGIFLFSVAAMFYVVVNGNPLSSITKALHADYESRYFEVASLKIFLGDIPRVFENFFLGILVALSIISVHGFRAEKILKTKLATTIRYLAQSTFTLYLFHFPVIFFLYAALKPDKNSALQVGTIAILVFLSCLAFSYIGERNGYAYRRLFLSGINFILRISSFTVRSNSNSSPITRRASSNRLT